MSTIPEGWGEREALPRHQRWPAELAARVTQRAEEAQQRWHVALFYIVKFGLDELDRRDLAAGKKLRRNPKEK